MTPITQNQIYDVYLNQFENIFPKELPNSCLLYGKRYNTLDNATRYEWKTYLKAVHFHDLNLVRNFQKRNDDDRNACEATIR